MLQSLFRPVLRPIMMGVMNAQRTSSAAPPSATDLLEDDGVTILYADDGATVLTED